MANLNAEIYDAFVAAGIGEEAARKAAFSVVDNDQELTKLRKDLAEIRTEQQVQRWMRGTNIALPIALLFKAFA